MKAKRYSTEFKSSIVTLYNEGRSANSLANEYHLAVQTVTGWVKKAQIIGTDVTGKPVTRAQFNAMQKEVARPNLMQCRKKSQDSKKKTKF
ncbi:transposase [Leuconostoc pseudomesenteroides]|nr:transposase [Leuconostoc pseudomesenteroides]